jgi:hypothetical protein
MGFYSKFSERDLIESYKNQVDHQGKATKELLEEISRRGSIEDFKIKIEEEKTLLNERNRIIREIHQNYMNKTPKKESLAKLDSYLLSKQEIRILVEEKYTEIHQNVENLEVNSDTLLKSFAGVCVAPIISSIIILTLVASIQQLIIFHFFLLVPAYIINYLVINKITGKTRSNISVFIATFIATLLNLLIFILFII